VYRGKERIGGPRWRGRPARDDAARGMGKLQGTSECSRPWEEVTSGRCAGRTGRQGGGWTEARRARRSGRRDVAARRRVQRECADLGDFDRVFLPKLELKCSEQ
jgi:hypothetical protein